MIGKKAAIIVIGIAITAAAVFCFFFLSDKNAEDNRGPFNNYNVVVLVSDALRADVLGCYGGDAKTPNIDWLAGRGVVFENAYSTAPCTLPSSVSMMTGNYSRAYGYTLKDEHKNLSQKYSFYVNNSETLLGEALKGRGFDVKMDVENNIASRSNNLQGFEPFRSIKQMSKQETALVEKIIRPQFSGRHWGRGEGGWEYGRMYDLLYYLLTVPADRHFFLLKWFLDPHGAYNPPKMFRERIPLDSSKLSKEPQFYYNSALKEIRKLYRADELSGYELYYIKALYKAEVEFVDHRVGTVIKALKHRGLLEKTIIVFTSDHGELFGEHGRMGHAHDFYETLVRVPLIIGGPGLPKGKREKTVVSHLDFTPTLKDLLGVDYSSNMQGKSYSALFHGGAMPDRIAYFDAVSNEVDAKIGMDALLIDGYKLVRQKKKNRPRFAIFNITDDPGETKNIADENPRLFKKMFKKIMELRKENGIRLQQNLAKIDKGVNLSEEWKKSVEQLKALGYL